MYLVFLWTLLNNLFLKNMTEIEFQLQGWTDALKTNLKNFLGLDLFYLKINSLHTDPILKQKTNEPHHEKTCLCGFQQGKTQATEAS